jgi:hypothetical protein
VYFGHDTFFQLRFPGTAPCLIAAFEQDATAWDIAGINVGITSDPNCGTIRFDELTLQP